MPYYWAGAKAYDLLAGSSGITGSYFITKRKTLEIFPHLSSKSLKGAIVYHDGTMNDSRMNVSLALTAVKEGAVVANHVEVTALHKNEAGKLTGATLRDTLNGSTWSVKADAIINATGPFTGSFFSFHCPFCREELFPNFLLDYSRFNQEIG